MTQALKENFLSMKQSQFVEKITKGASVSAAAKYAGISPKTGKRWLETDEGVRGAVQEAFREAGLDPSEIIHFHKKIRDLSLKKGNLGESRRANLDLGKAMGVFADRDKNTGGNDDEKLGLLEKLVERLEAREVKATVVSSEVADASVRE